MSEEKKPFWVGCFLVLICLWCVLVIVVGSVHSSKARITKRDIGSVHFSKTTAEIPTGEIPTDIEKILIAVDNIGPNIPYNEREEKLIAIKNDIIKMMKKQHKEMQRSPEKTTRAINREDKTYSTVKKVLYKSGKYSYYSRCSICDKFHDEISEKEYKRLVDKEVAKVTEILNKTLYKNYKRN